MPAYNFKKEFGPMVENGTKCQTIRPKRKRPTVVGDTLYLYTGMRTKQCQKLGEAVCKSVEPIEITSAGVKLDGVWLFDRRKLLQLVHNDGFYSDTEFFDFFETQYGLPVEMELIRW